MHCHRAACQLLFQGLIGPEQQLLSRLTSRVKGSLDLHAAKRSSVKKSAILPGKRYALRDALVDDIDADLGETVDVGLARAKVTAFDRVLKQAEDAVAVVAIILRGVNPSLGCDGVCAARRVVKRKAFDVVALLAERGGGRRS